MALCHSVIVPWQRTVYAMPVPCHSRASDGWIHSTNGPFQTDRAAGKYDGMLASTRVIVRDEGLGAMYKVPASCAQLALETLYAV